VNASLQVKTGSMFNLAAFDLDLRNRNHVKQRALLTMFRFKLPGIRGILPSLAKDHVKHEFEHVKHGSEHVKLCVELPCIRAITSTIV
jgi:hypothetical protein